MNWKNQVTDGLKSRNRQPLTQAVGGHPARKEPMKQPTKPIQFSPADHTRLVESATRRGFHVGRGRGSQLAESVMKLVELEQTIRAYLTADGDERRNAYARLLELLGAKWHPSPSAPDVPEGAKTAPGTLPSVPESDE